MPVGDLLSSQGALPAARLLIRRLIRNLSFITSFTIFAVSFLISASSITSIILLKGKALALDSSQFIEGEVMRRVTVCFPELKNSALTLADCFCSRGSHSSRRKSTPSRAFSGHRRPDQPNGLRYGARCDTSSPEDLAKKFVQIQGQFENREPGVLGLILLSPRISTPVGRTAR